MCFQDGPVRAFSANICRDGDSPRHLIQIRKNRGGTCLGHTYRLNASSTSGSASTSRIPLPPPPSNALIMTGYPSTPPKTRMSSLDKTLVPAAVLTSREVARSRERSLSEAIRSVSGDGPTKMIESGNASARAGLSLKNPYPGWRWVHPVLSFKDEIDTTSTIYILKNIKQRTS